MEHVDLLDVITREANVLATAARSVGPEAAVPATPEWTMAKLVKHTGTTHRWVMAIAATREFANPGDLDLGLPDDEAGYPDWIEAGAATLTATLVDMDPDSHMWSWGPDAHVRFWSRRMAHETAIHRWDAQSATGASEPIEVGLATDGIDERLANLTASLGHGPLGPEALRGGGETVHLHATDGDGEWLLQFGPEGIAVSREHAKGDVAVRGPVSDLLLYLVGRRGLEGFDIFGDESVLTARDAIRSF